MKTGVYFWPGSEAPIKGIRPSYWVHYNQSIPYNDRVNKVIEWMSYDHFDRPQIYFMYFEGVDTAGHIYGPQSDQVKNAINEVDQAIKLLYNSVNEKKNYF